MCSVPGSLRLITTCGGKTRPPQVAVQRAPIALRVTEQDRGRPGLSSVVAHARPLVQGVRPRGGAAQFRVPVAGDRQQARVERLLQPFHRLGVGDLEVAVLARPEPVPAHVDRCPEVGVALVQIADGSGFGVGEQAREQGAGVLVDFGGDFGPVAGFDAPPPPVGRCLVSAGLAAARARADMAVIQVLAGRPW